MSDDIIERMRFWSKTRNDNPTAWNLDCGAAADEIERLRAKLQNAYDRTKTLTDDRDRARIEVCKLLAVDDLLRSDEEIAAGRGWDCFDRGD